MTDESRSCRTRVSLERLLELFELHVGSRKRTTPGISATGLASIRPLLTAAGWDGPAAPPPEAAVR